MFGVNFKVHISILILFHMFAVIIWFGLLTNKLIIVYITLFQCGIKSLSNINTI